MPTDRLTDARDTSLDQADTMLRELFDARLAILRREAAAEAQISEIRERLRLDTAQHRLLVELREAQLSAFILANRDLFDRPRMRRTSWGSYGLRSSSRLEIREPDLLIQWAKDNGYTDLYRTTETLLKPAVAKRLAAGEIIPGADVDHGEASEYKLDTAALEAAL